MCAWALMCVVLGAADIWEAKPFASWSDKEVKELLSDSPWAGKASLTHTRPGGGSPAIDDTVIVSWTSALPMRQANVREAIGLNGTVTADHQAFLSQEQPAYVIALKIEGMSAMAARVVAPIAKETTLRRGKKPPIPVAQANSVALDRDGKVVEMPARGAPGGAPQAGDAPPAGRGGGGGGRGGFGGFGGGFGGGGSTIVVFAFPKTDPITLDDKEVELVSRIGQYNVKKKFKLKDMVVNGQLAL
jgi:hypothetical protein